MPASRSLTHAQLIARKKARRSALSDETLIQTPDQQTPDRMPEISPIISGPEMRNPANVIALQRAFGNHAAMKMLQRNAIPLIQRDPKDEEQPDDDIDVDDDTYDEEIDDDIDNDNDQDDDVEQDDDSDIDDEKSYRGNEDDDGSGDGDDDDLNALNEDEDVKDDDEVTSDDVSQDDVDEVTEEDPDDDNDQDNDVEEEQGQGLGDIGTEGSGLSGNNQVGISGNVAPATNKAKFRSRRKGKLNQQDVQFGAYKGYKAGKKIKGGVTGIIDNTDSVGSVAAITTEQYGQQFTGAADLVANAAGSGSILATQAALSGFMGLLMPYVKLIKLAVKIPMSIKKTHKTRQNMSSLKSAFKASKTKAAEGDVGAQAVYEAAKYGFRKVRRQFAERVTKIIVAIIKFATIITELATGGTAILFTSASKLLTGATTGIMTAIAAAKSVYKTIKGTKGVNRQFNAEKLIDAANAGNPEALHLFFKLKIGKAVWMKQNHLTKSKNPFKKEVDFFLKNETGYRQWIMTLKSKEWGSMRGELAKKLRSTTAKTFTEKRRQLTR